MGHNAAAGPTCGTPPGPRDDRVVSTLLRPGAIRRVARALPWLIRARWLTSRTPDVRELIAAHDRRPRRTGRSSPSVDDLRRGTDGAIGLIGPREKHCLARALTLFALLTREGHEPEFVSGIRRDDSRLVGHAWVEIDGNAVEASGHPAMSTMYREHLRVPSANRSGASCRPR